MSGGEWDYVFSKFEDVANRLLNEECPYRRALSQQVGKIATALYKIEWADSGDIAQGDEIESIKIALNGAGDNLALDILIDDGKKIIEQIQELVNELK